MQIFSGIVQKGSTIASELGYPTANIPYEGDGASGVYAAKVKVGEEEYEAMVFADHVRHVLEAHVLDFSADLYGWKISIELLEKIRDRKKFKDNLVPQALIDADMARVRAYFKNAQRT